jgi:hypothetical protein
LTDTNRKAYWDVVLPKLRKALIGVDFSGDGLEISQSVTEYEVKSAFANISDDDKTRLCGCVASLLAALLSPRRNL